MQRILICDDAAAFSVLLTRWIESDPELEVVGASSDSDEALALARDLVPDVVILDHLLGPNTSETLAPRFREAAPGARVLVISGMPGDILASAAASAGADAYISKASSAEQILQAIRSAAGQAPAT